jgi:hypothetical protein
MGAEIWLAGLAAAGCAPSASFDWIGFPQLNGARTIVIALEESGEATLVQAVDVTTSSAPLFRRALSNGQPAKLEALVFTQTATAIGLPLGPLLAAEAGAPSRRLPDPVPTNGALFDRELAPQLAQRWSSTGTLTGALASFRLPVHTSTACVLFDLHAIRVQAAGNPSWAAAVDTDTGLVGTFDGHLVRVRDGTADLLAVTSSEAMNITGGMVDASGQLWIAGFGYLARASIVGDRLITQVVTSTDDASAIHWLAADTSASNFEFLTMTFDGRVRRYDGRAWTLLYNFDVMPRFQGGLVRLGPGRALFALDTDPEVLLLQGSQLTQLPLPMAVSLDVIGVLADIPGLGPLASISNHISVFDGEGFASIPGDLSSVEFHAVAPFNGGFVGISFDGRINQYMRSGICPFIQDTSHANGRFMFPIGKGLAFVGEDPVDGTLTITFGRPRTP